MVRRGLPPEPLSILTNQGDGHQNLLNPPTPSTDVLQSSLDPKQFLHGPHRTFAISLNWILILGSPTRSGRPGGGGHDRFGGWNRGFPTKPSFLGIHKYKIPLRGWIAKRFFPLRLQLRSFREGGDPPNPPQNILSGGGWSFTMALLSIGNFVEARWSLVYPISSAHAKAKKPQRPTHDEASKVLEDEYESYSWCNT